MSYAAMLYSRFGLLPSEAVASFRGDPSIPLIDQAVLDDAFKLPNEKAVEFLKAKGYKITFSYKDMSADMHSRAFTVAKVLNADVLQTIYDDVSSALTDGRTFEDFQKGLVPKLQSAGFYGKQDVVDPATGKVSRTEISSRSRLENIYRTNLQSAYMDARYDQAKAAVDAFPFVRIDALLDDATSQVCRDADGKVYRMDDKGLKLPPYHYRCRTGFEPVDEEEFAALGVKVSDPKGLTEGAHPISESFDRPPGTPWEPDTSKYATGIRNQLEDALVAK